jgi:hypothetical protein
MGDNYGQKITFDREGKRTLVGYDNSNTVKKQSENATVNENKKIELNDSEQIRKILLADKEQYILDPTRYKEYFDIEYQEQFERTNTGSKIVKKGYYVIKSDKDIQNINREKFKNFIDNNLGRAPTNTERIQFVNLLAQNKEDIGLFKKQQDIKKQKLENSRNQRIKEQGELDQKVKNVSNRGDILNLEQLIKDKDVWFRKSYSAFDSLTPYIKCYIQIPELKIDDKTLVRDINRDYFEIPYNMIKSLEVEFSASPGVAGTFILKLEDPTGIIGNIIIAQLYSLGILKNKDGMPKINIEFGWADKALKKIVKRKDYNRMFTKNFFTEYMIEKSDIEFSEKYKQELTIKGHQDQVGIIQLSDDKNDSSPYKTFGPTLIESLKVINYYHYFTKNNKNNDYGLNILNYKKLVFFSSYQLHSYLP